MPFEGDLRMPQDHVHHLRFPTLTPRMENKQSCLEEHSIPDNTVSSSEIQYPLKYTNQVHDPGMFAFGHTHMQIPHNPVGLWSPSDMSSMPSLPAAVNETHNGHMEAAYYYTYDLNYNDTHVDDRIAISPSSTLWSTSHCTRRPLFSVVSQETRDSHDHFHRNPSVYPSLERSLYEALLNRTSVPSNETDFDLNHIPYPVDLKADSRSQIPIYSAPHQNFTTPSRRRGAARAIEYGGMWIDEAGLLKGLAELDGKIWVVQCCWEQPCHLWIKGDKASINTHIQKWHGGKPGGDKTQADCRWDASGRKMLKESIARHIVGVHLGEMWECQGCGKEIVRNDAYGRHAMKSSNKACQTSGALITYSVDAREIDARSALDSGGRVKYAGA